MTTTVKSGFWGDTAPTLHRPSGERRVARYLKVRGLQPIREIMVEMLGIAVGEDAYVSYKRKTAATGQQGGAQTIETVEPLDRVTATADIATVATNLGTYPVTGTKPTNGDGNPRGNNGG